MTPEPGSCEPESGHGSLPPEAPPPPGLIESALFTGLAWISVPLVASLALPFTTPTAALGIAITLGVGGVALLGASRVLPPQAERLGLRGFPLRRGLPLLLLLPTLVLTSEVDNLLREVAPPPDAHEIAERTRERVATGTPLALTETLIVVAGLAPIAEEWLFRGVIQQGLVARHGAVAGVVLTAVLFGVGHGGPGISAQAWLAVATAGFATGVVLGVARAVTGSLLAPILLHGALNALATAALALGERFPVAGLNAPGAHVPAAWLVASAASVALGLGLLRGRS